MKADYNLDWMQNVGQETDYEPLPEFQRPEDEWQKQRLGMITGSNFGKLVKTDRKGGYVLSSGKVADDLIYKIAWMRLLRKGAISDGLGRLSVNSASMTHGNDFEPLAVQCYEERTGNKVKYVQSFVEYDEWIGGTPDGYVDDDGIIEVKCPWNGGNHLQSILEQKVYNPEYVYQIQGYLWITDRKWCDFITYDPDLIDELQLNIIRVERDDNMIAGISEVMDQVKQRIQEIINQIEKR
jgi:hypothetical protein